MKNIFKTIVDKIKGGSKVKIVKKSKKPVLFSKKK